VYENFSHGVFSNWMIFLFLFPLLGGVLPTLALLGLGERLWLPDRAVRNLWNCGVATLTVGSSVAGVLEIYGTTSDYLPVYGIVGGILVIAGALTYGLRRAVLLKKSPEP